MISALLANLYLHWFDALFHGRPQGPARSGKAQLVRYADDMVVLARQWTPELTEYIETRLEGKFQLEINRDKTRIVDLKEEKASLDFLGYTFQYDRDLKGRARKYLNLFPSEKALEKERAKLQGNPHVRLDEGRMSHALASLTLLLYRLGIGAQPNPSRDRKGAVLREAEPIS